MNLTAGKNINTFVVYFKVLNGLKHFVEGKIGQDDATDANGQRFNKEMIPGRMIGRHQRQGYKTRVTNDRRIQLANKIKRKKLFIIDYSL